MLECIARIDEYAGNDELRFRSSRMVQDAVIRNLQTLTVGTATVGYQGNEVRVTLTGILDNKRVTVSLTGVNGTIPVQASVGFLVGDVCTRNRRDYPQAVATKTPRSSV